MTECRAASCRIRNVRGFTLLELAVVMVIIAVIGAAGLSVGKATLDSAQVAATNQRLNTIETALLAYRRANDRLPCPADATLAQSNANFGQQAANAGVCTGGTPAANYSFTSGASTTVEGALPVRALNLPDEFMYDGWGRKFVYAVWAPITGFNGFVNYGISSNCGLMTVRNAVGASRTNRGLYTLMSFGPNGHGGRNVAGQTISTASVNTDEQINCHCNASGANTGYLGTYVQKDYTENPANGLDLFDDIVRFKERWQLQNYFDEYNPGGYLTCPTTGPGSRSYGAAAQDNMGSAMAMGDVNGDGIQDLIIGMPRKTGVGSAGSVAVIFGTLTGIPNPFDITTLTGENGFIINSSQINDWTGAALDVGDFNNDGIVDIVIGAPRANAAAGRVYVVYGHIDPWPATFGLATIDGTNGFLLINDVAAGEEFGSALAVGDLNRDGMTDLVVGAPLAGGNAGAVYTIMGKTTAWAASNNLDTVKRSRMAGRTNSRAGTAVLAQDVNADRIPDLIVGMPGDGVTMTGEVEVTFGRRLGWKYLTFKKNRGPKGYTVRGEVAGSRFGASLAYGDVNADYIGDIVVGAPNYTGNAGAAYIVFGNVALKAKYWRTASVNGVIGARVTGAAGGNLSGSQVQVADINGDGMGDLVIGSPGASPGALPGAGTVHVFFGKRTWASTVSLSTIDGTVGFNLNGSTAGDGVGSALGRGDANSDYLADILIGAPLADYSASNSGAMYLFYGQRRPAPWTLNVDLNSL